MNASNTLTAIKNIVADMEAKYNRMPGLESQDYHYFYEDVCHLVLEMYHPDEEQT